MTSKPPIPARLRSSSLRSRALPRTSHPGTTSRSHRDLVRKPRSAIVAFGVAAIVITGTIFGAQLKTSRQVTDRSRLVAAGNADEVPATSAQTPSKQPTTPPSHVVNDADILQHIKLLEDRRAILNRQKNGFQSKLEALHERKRKREAQAQAQASR